MEQPVRPLQRPHLVQSREFGVVRAETGIRDDHADHHDGCDDHTDPRDVEHQFAEGGLLETHVEVARADTTEEQVQQQRGGVGLRRCRSTVPLPGGAVLRIRLRAGVRRPCLRGRVGVRRPSLRGHVGHRVGIHRPSLRGRAGPTGRREGPPVGRVGLHHRRIRRGGGRLRIGGRHRSVSSHSVLTAPRAPAAPYSVPPTIRPRTRSALGAPTTRRRPLSCARRRPRPPIRWGG